MDDQKKSESPAGGLWQDHMRRIDPDAEAAGSLKGSSVLLGFSCDEGVRRNHGRPGARSGPEAIRDALGRLAWHHSGELLDAGDVLCPGDDLESAQAEFGNRISRLLQAGVFPIGIGGGHEIAFGHVQGIREAIGEQTLGIINFDAHFDMRGPVDGKGNSGTSFYQIAQQEEARGRAFNYLCIGLQKENNTRMLFDTAERYRAEWIEAFKVNLFNRESLTGRLDWFLEKVDHVYLSFCLDVFNASIAPGVSAVNPLGIYPDIILYLIQHIVGSGKVISLDLAELNPLYDIDQRTARLAAALIFHALDWRGSSDR